MRSPAPPTRTRSKIRSWAVLPERIFYLSRSGNLGSRGDATPARAGGFRKRSQGRRNAASSRFSAWTRSKTARPRNAPSLASKRHYPRQHLTLETARTLCFAFQHKSYRRRDLLLRSPPETDCQLHVFPDLARMVLIGTQSERAEKQQRCAGWRIKGSKAQAQQRKIDPVRRSDPQKGRSRRVSIVLRRG